MKLHESVLTCSFSNSLTPTIRWLVTPQPHFEFPGRAPSLHGSQTAAVQCMSSGRGAAWLARLLGVQEVPGSNPGGPTNTPMLVGSLLFPDIRPDKIQI